MDEFIAKLMIIGIAYIMALVLGTLGQQLFS